MSDIVISSPITFALGAGLFALVKRGKRTPSGPTPSATADTSS